MASVEPLESNSCPPSPPRLNIGTPSITYNALLDWSMPFVPRITTLLAPPTPDELVLIVTPATLPESELIRLASFTVVKASLLIS